MTVPPASNDATDETGAGAADARPGRDAPEPGMRGIWSRQTLNRRIVEENLVTKGDGASAFDEARLDSAGYRLAMGREVYVSPEKSAVRSSVRKLEEQEAFLIPAGQFAFLITDEVVTVPDDAFAFIALRSKKTKFRGWSTCRGSMPIRGTTVVWCSPSSTQGRGTSIFVRGTNCSRSCWRIWTLEAKDRAPRARAS